MRFLFSLQLKTDFLKLLKETSGIDRNSRWSDVKKKINSDPRYEAVDSSSRREDWFKDYVKNLDEVLSTHYSFSNLTILQFVSMVTVDPNLIEIGEKEQFDNDLLCLVL